MLVKTGELTGPALDWAVATLQKLPIKKDPMGFGRQSPGGYWVWDDAFPPCIPYMQIGDTYSPSTNWSQGGPIMDEAGISVLRCESDWTLDANGFWTEKSKRIPVWAATTGEHCAQTQYESENYAPQFEISESGVVYGPTQLVAGMRCFVASKLGDEVKLPYDLEKLYETA